MHNITIGCDSTDLVDGNITRKTGGKLHALLRSISLLHLAPLSVWSFDKIKHPSLLSGTCKTSKTGVCWIPETHMQDPAPVIALSNLDATSFSRQFSCAVGLNPSQPPFVCCVVGRSYTYQRQSIESPMFVRHICVYAPPIVTSDARNVFDYFKAWVKQALWSLPATWIPSLVVCRSGKADR